MNVATRMELMDALDDFLEHADNAGLEEVYEGIDVDDAYGLLLMLEEGNELEHYDLVIARKILEYEKSYLELLANDLVLRSDEDAKILNDSILLVAEAIQTLPEQ